MVCELLELHKLTLDCCYVSVIGERLDVLTFGLVGIVFYGMIWLGLFGRPRTTREPLFRNLVLSWKTADRHCAFK